MKALLYIQNLKCKGCEATILNKLSKLDNINNVSIDLAHTIVKFDCKTQSDIDLVKAELSRIGYPPFGEKNRLARKTKSFVSCETGKTYK